MAQVVVEASGANSAIRSTRIWPHLPGVLPIRVGQNRKHRYQLIWSPLKNWIYAVPVPVPVNLKQALQMLSTLNINPADIVSKVVTIDEVPEAVKELDQFPERHLKINVKFI